MAPTSPTLPNPLTPLAWLPPDDATRVQIAQYMISILFGAWVWDSLISVREEFRILVKRRVSFPDLFYLLSRVGTCASLILTMIFISGHVSDCETLNTALTICAAVAQPINCLLFFFRVRAVYHDMSKAIGFFAFLWLTTLAGAVTSPLSSHGAELGDSGFCILSGVNHLEAVGVILILIHDTIVYLAISLRLTMWSLLEGAAAPQDSTGKWRYWLKSFCSGQGMNKISRTLLKTGQLYYLATVGLNIAGVVVTLSSTCPVVYRGAILIIGAAIQNSVACRVYRQLKLGAIVDIPTSSGALASDAFRSRFAVRAITPIEFKTLQLTPSDGEESMGNQSRFNSTRGGVDEFL